MGTTGHGEFPNAHVCPCHLEPGGSPATLSPSLTRSDLASEGLPPELLLLLDPKAPAQLPPAMAGDAGTRRLSNRGLDRLLCALGRSRATWRRALMVLEWLKASGFNVDARLATTVVRLCADNGDAVAALGVYEWMRAPKEAGGAGLQPSSRTYVAVMKAALCARLPERAVQVWTDAEAAGFRPDGRMCVVQMEACARLGQTDRALSVYAAMRSQPAGSPTAPTVHAYTAAMKAACDGERWDKAMSIWEDLWGSELQPNGHAYSAAMRACAARKDWLRAVSLFEDMAEAGIAPDVVSCTSLVLALASGGQADKAEAVVQWMLANGLRPNVSCSLAHARIEGREVWDGFSLQDPLYAVCFPCPIRRCFFRADSHPV